MTRPCAVTFHSHSQTQANINLFFVSIDLTFLKISYKWNHIICGLMWFNYFLNVVSPSIAFLRLVHVVTFISTLFLFILEEYSIAWIYHISFIYSPTDGPYVCSPFWLLRIMLLWTWVYKYLFEILLSILWGICAEVELLDHIVILSLITWGNTILFSIVTVTISTSSTPGSQFLHVLANTHILFFW